MAKRAVLLGLILLILASVRGGYAQAAQPEVLNAADIFTSNVKVVQTLPTVSFDNTMLHSAYVLDSGASTWRVYPYPKDLNVVKDVLQQPDGTWLLTSEGFYAFQLPLPSNTWIFDPKTGIFTHPQGVCGTIKNAPGESWRLYQADPKSPFRVCSTETGRLSQPLPQAIQQKVCDNAYSPVQVSPDKKWLLFSDCAGYFSLYSYEIATDRFISLSPAPSPDDMEIIRVDRWIDNTHAMVYSSRMSRASPRAYSLVDVTRANSQQIIISGGTIDTPLAGYYENPRRYEWYTLGNEFGAPCTFHRFDFATLKTTEMILPVPICGGIPLPDGSGDRLAFNPDDPDLKPVVEAIRYNLTTGSSRTLFKGAIAWVQNISPGGSYTDLFTGELFREIGESFTYPRPYPIYGGEDVSKINLAVFDLKTGKQVFQSPLARSQEVRRYEGFGDIWPFLSPQFTWLQDDTFFLVDAAYHKDANTATYTTRFIHLQGGKATEQAAVPGNVIAFDTGYLVLENPQTDGITSLSLYDVKRNRVIPVISKLDFRRYDLDVQLRADDSLEVTINDWSRRSMDYQNMKFPFRHWIVNVQ